MRAVHVTSAILVSVMAASLALLAPVTGCEHGFGHSQAAGNAPSLPANWQGTGILARRTDAPRNAPPWAAIRAEVVAGDDGQRSLRATGKAEDIANPALARSTADNRARAEMLQWLQQSTLNGARIIDTWQGDDIYIVRVELPLTADTLTPIH